MKPTAYITKSGVLFKNAPDAPLELTPLYEMPKPLTHGEILNMYLDFTNGNRDLDVFEFARAIEERHGIK
jgi:hypothetical protein